MAVAAVVLLATTLAGCADGAITAGRLQSSVGPTFANLWTLQQQRQGHTHPPVAALRSEAACHRSDPAEPAVGAAADWVCAVTWLVDGPGTPARALYNVNVMTDGCYSADGDGPSSLNGSATLTTATGAPAVNPLFKFNSCFDTT